MIYSDVSRGTSVRGCCASNLDLLCTEPGVIAQGSLVGWVNYIDKSNLC